MKTMLSTAFAASSFVYCNSYEISDTLNIDDVIHVEFDNDFKWRFSDKEIEIDKQGKSVVKDNCGDDVVIEFRINKPICGTDIEGLSNDPCVCMTGEWSGSPNPSNPDNEWLCDECNRVICAH